MKAAWYERNGKAKEVLVIGEMPDPKPAKGEVRVKIACSGLNPSDVKRREGTRGQNIEFPRVIPNSDGAGVVVRAGDPSGEPAPERGFDRAAGRRGGDEIDRLVAARLSDRAGVLVHRVLGGRCGEEIARTPVFRERSGRSAGGDHHHVLSL